MTAHADILDEREPSPSRWVAASLVLHVLVVGAVAGYGWWQNHGRVSLGDQNAMGGAVGISAVNSIPLPRRSERENPVANDTDSTAPSPPKEKKTKAAPKEDEDAIPLNNKRKPRKERERETVETAQNYRPQPDKPNQVFSSTGAAASTPMLGGQQGIGGVGTGNAVFGARLGWYAQLLTQTLAQKWGTETQRITPGMQNSRRTMLAFEILRDGTIRNVRVLESSGNYEIDTAAQRAVLSANPFRRLPEQFERNVANVEFWFQLQR